MPSCPLACLALPLPLRSGTYRSAIHLISQALVPPTNPTVRSVLSLRSDTGIFISVLGNSSYASWLDSTTLVKSTVFAPTDAAFNTLLANYNYTLAQFLAGQGGVQQILDVSTGAVLVIPYSHRTYS